MHKTETTAEALDYPPIPLQRAVSMLAMGMKKRLRELWNDNTPEVNREWFWGRSKGLRAYARYCASCMLKPYAAGGKLSVDGYAEATIQDRIREYGLGGWANLDGLKDGFDWKEFLDWKRRKDPKFFTRLTRWMEVGKDLDSNRPDPRLQLYASLYDRNWPVPFEFCTDSYAADRINELVESREWPGAHSQTNQEGIRGWRRLLKLSLAKPAALKSLNNGAEIVLDHKAAIKHGIPIDDRLLSQGRKRK